MNGGSVPGYAHDRLIAGKGLSLDAERTGGPMGSATWRITNGIIDIEIYSDRGLMGAAAGRHGGRTFDVAVWARALSAGVANSVAIDEQIDFLADNLEVITQLVQAEPEIETKLRDINWVAVKDRLNLSPEANREAPGSWIN
ncbi:hypothetical protein ACIBTW_28850 [Micromonospora parva]|uniref:hypothetical protein n=1 Tax=Micromonospora parva TaxID=1464048 RepID=UPI0037BA9F4C